MKTIEVNRWQAIGYIVELYKFLILLVRRAVMAQKKIYILDTNVLIYDPNSIFEFKNTHIGIVITVLEELDIYKDEQSERGYNTRVFIRKLDVLRHRGSLKDGVLLDNGSTLQIFFPPEGTYEKVVNKPDIDHIILETARALQESGYELFFVSKDISARVKADLLGINAVDYIKEKLDEKHFYKGWVTLDVPAIQLKKDHPEELAEYKNQEKLIINEFVCLRSQHNPVNYRLFRYLGGETFKSVYNPNLQWGLEARNVQQLMALDLLLDPSIHFVSLIGPAGTGKTFLTLLAGLHQVLVTNCYQKILISRPVIPLGPDIGYLPGDIQEKLLSWMQPVYDNMELILHATSTKRHLDFLAEQDQNRWGKHERSHKYDKKRKFGRDKKERKAPGQLGTIEQLADMGKISLEAITYMRGRSIPYQFIFIDEVQNLTPHEVKTLITRVGVDSKIVLSGDPFQIDSPTLNFSSNGLIIATDRFKGQSIFGSVYLEQSERSELSRLAGSLL
ncbi:MAG TPA: PhoH family protein [Candidatus Babeliales bacterium]|nr:PhoH family protein [Candidatus Babeliales bacterium]